MKHVFWKWKMDLVLLPSPSILSYHSQGYIAHQVIKYQEHMLWKMFTYIFYLSMEYVGKVKWMSNPLTDKIYTHSHTYFSQFTENAYNCFTYFSGLGTEIYKSSLKMSNTLRKRPGLFLKATVVYLKHHSLATNPLLKTAVGLYTACGIPPHRFQKQMNAQNPCVSNPLCFKKLTLKTEVLRRTAW